MKVKSNKHSSYLINEISELQAVMASNYDVVGAFSTNSLDMDDIEAITEHYRYVLVSHLDVLSILFGVVVILLLY